MESRHRTHRHGEVEIAFTDTPGPPGRTFVLVHGIGMGRVVFAELGETLSRSGRVLAIDLPGFGDSPEPGSLTSIADTAENVARFIRQEAAGSVVLVGHSMGTQVVSEIALHHPDLVKALVLIAPTVNRRERTALRQGLRMAQDLVDEGPKVLLLGLWQYAKTNPMWFVNKLKFMLNHRLEGICPDISAPTLLLRGETDPVCPPEWVAELADAFPNATAQQIDDRGHEAIIKSPEPVASMIREFIGAGSEIEPNAENAA